MGLEKAEELITQGGWSDLYVIYLRLSQTFPFTLMKNA